MKLADKMNGLMKEENEDVKVGNSLTGKEKAWKGVKAKVLTLEPKITIKVLGGQYDGWILNIPDSTELSKYFKIK